VGAKETILFEIVFVEIDNKSKDVTKIIKKVITFALKVIIGHVSEPYLFRACSVLIYMEQLRTWYGRSTESLRSSYGVCTELLQSRLSGITGWK